MLVIILAMTMVMAMSPVWLLPSLAPLHPDPFGRIALESGVAHLLLEALLGLLAQLPL